jgi:hypothetical protein
MWVARGGPSEERVVSFKHAHRDEPVSESWDYEITVAEQALKDLLQRKQDLLRRDPQAETVLWHRYNIRLMKLRRTMEAISF